MPVVRTNQLAIAVENTIIVIDLHDAAVTEIPIELEQQLLLSP